MKHSIRNYGFTLIELLVVITILLIITGGAIASFTTFRDRRTAEENANKVRALFVTAQQKAALKDSPAACISSATIDRPPLQGYRVSYNSGTQTFSLSALCGNSPPTDPNGIPTDANLTPHLITDSNANSIKNVVVPTTITVGAGLTKFDFYTLERGTTLYQTLNAAPVVYSFTLGRVYQFTVSPSGTVSNVQAN